MLPAIGASVALDAIQSLTSPSQPTGSGGFDLDESSDVSPPVSGTIAGFSSAQISSDNFNALLDAQSLDSGGLASTLGSGGSPSDSSQSGTASSAYNSVNQLVQSTAVPLAFSPFSMSA